MADEQSINALIQKSVDEFGGIDGLVNMAALVKPEIQWRDVEVARMETEIWKMTMDVNLIGFGLATKAALAHMVAQKHGAIRMLRQRLLCML
ncbi:short-chain dehydrogenase reductase sdr [Neofusicoccum parvum]|nr:short-chain dehydrogenase reductase sdr [Neofusicoccum parvum]